VPLLKRSVAELVGTFWLVLGGCGAAVVSAAFPRLGVGHLGVALAFGLTVLTAAYALGPISGAHFNPAVTVGLWAAKRFPFSEVAAYVGAQVLGAVVGAGVLLLIASGREGFSLASGLGANGFGEHSPGGYSLGSAVVTELVMTFMFLLVILGVTDKDVPQGFAPIAIGFALALVHIVSIPVTGTSVNPARSTGPALYVGGWALTQLWMFWLVPLAGAVLAGLAYPALASKRVTPSPSAAEAGVRPQRRPA
jgi:aquaporin Z